MKLMFAIAFGLTTTMVFGQQGSDTDGRPSNPYGNQFAAEGIAKPAAQNSGGGVGPFGYDSGMDAMMSSMAGLSGPVTAADRNDPNRGMKPVERDLATLEGVLTETQTLVLVVDDMVWYHHRLPTSFDRIAFQSLAGAILKSLEGDDQEDRMQRYGVRAELHLAYTSKQYEKSGKYIPNVLEKLKEAADRRQSARTESRTRQLLGDESPSGDEKEDSSRSASLYLFDDSDDRLLSFSALRQTYQRAERVSQEIASQLGSDIDVQIVSGGPVTARLVRPETDAKRKALRAAVEEAFQLRIKLQTAELDQAETKIKAARERLAWRQRNAEQLIQERVQKLAQWSSDEGTVEESGSPE